MSNITDPVLVAPGAPSIASFGPGGQMYNADIFGGFNISAQQVNPLFSFRSTDPGVVNAPLLTNLTEAQKIGSTMDFKAVALGVRIIPTGVSGKGDTALTPDEAAAMKSLLASAVITLTYGSNETKIAEFTGMHLTAPVDFTAADATNTCAVTNGAINSTAWIKLSMPVGIEANLNIGGTVRFTKPVPASLYETANTFAFVVVLSGLKIVKS